MMIKEILLIFGGTSAIAIGISAFIGKLISNKIISKWQLENQKQLELLKGEISKNQNVTNTLLSTFSSGFQSAQDKRIEAIEIIWDATLKTVTFSNKVSFIYGILTDDELKNVYKSDTKGAKNMRSHLDKINPEKFVDSTSDAVVQVEKLRAFITPEIYRLFKVLHVFSGRTMHLLIKDKPSLKITLWKKDKAIMTALRAELSDEEVNYALSLKFNSFGAIINVIESKILNECNKILSGELAMESSLEQAKKLAKLLDAEKKD